MNAGREAKAPCGWASIAVCVHDNISIAHQFLFATATFKTRNFIRHFASIFIPRAPARPPRAPAFRMCSHPNSTRRIGIQMLSASVRAGLYGARSRLRNHGSRPRGRQRPRRAGRRCAAITCRFWILITTAYSEHQYSPRFSFRADAIIRESETAVLPDPAQRKAPIPVVHWPPARVQITGTAQ